VISATAALTLLLAGQDLIEVDVSGSRQWRVAMEGPGGAVAFLPTARTADTREVVLITTAWIAGSPGEPAALSQAFFVHTLDCAAGTQARTGFGETDPPPRRWTPADGPPLSRPTPVPAPIQANTAMAVIADAVCRDGAPNLAEIEGDWSTVARTLRQRVEASRTGTGNP
jgi:hypothetical protein